MRALSILLFLFLCVGPAGSTVQKVIEPPSEEDRRAEALKRAVEMARKAQLCVRPARITNGSSGGRPPHPKVEPVGPPPPGRLEVEVLSLQALQRTEPWTLTLTRVGDPSEPRRVSLWAFEAPQPGQHFRRELVDLELGLYDLCLEPLGLHRAVYVNRHARVTLELPWLARVRVEPVGRAGLPLHAPRLGALAVSRMDGAWWTPLDGDSRLPGRLGNEKFARAPVRSIRAWHTDDGAWEFLCEAGVPLQLLPLQFSGVPSEPLRVTPRAGDTVVSLSM